MASGLIDWGWRKIILNWKPSMDIPEYYFTKERCILAESPRSTFSASRDLQDILQCMEKNLVKRDTAKCVLCVWEGHITGGGCATGQNKGNIQDLVIWRL